jgi:hypothetical protein
MNKAVYYKVMFIASGIYGIVAAAFFGLLAPFVAPVFNFFGLQKPTLTPDIEPLATGTYIWMYLALFLLGIYGFMYILVGIDITKNHLVISTGIIAKLSSSLVLTVSYILGECTWPVFILIGIDLIWAALFIEFYVNYKKLDRDDISVAYPYKVNE